MHLLRRIELYIRRSATSPTRLGRDAVGDPRFVSDLRNGRQPRPETRARVHQWLDRQEGARRGKGF